MHIWVDADAVPNVVKEILFRAAERVQVPLTMVANRAIKVPPSRFITSRQVSSGFDVADNHIVDELQAGDLVVTADIPLAADAIAKGATALNPRGALYTEANIRERLAMRNIHDELRGMGEVHGGPPALGKRERQNFAKALDKVLAAALR